jgi:hypothetical protein
MQVTREQQAHCLCGNIAKIGSGHVVGHLQVNYGRSTIFPPSDLTERPGAIWIGVEKAEPSGPCGCPAGGACFCFTLANLHDAPFVGKPLLSTPFRPGAEKEKTWWVSLGGSAVTSFI